MLPRNGKPHGQKTSAPVISFTRAHLPTVRANTVRPYGFACAYEFTCGAPRSAHPTGYRVPRLFNPQNICYNETIRYFEVEIVLLHTLRVKRNAGQGTPVKIPDRGHPFGCPLLCPQKQKHRRPPVRGVRFYSISSRTENAASCSVLSSLYSISREYALQMQICAQCVTSPLASHSYTSSS